MIILTQNDVNAKLHEEFYVGAEKFANNPLHQKLRGEGSLEEKLAFMPEMLFFVLGFKDLMNMVRYENPKNEQEKSVNIHSDEDNYHWEWYLKDLEFINHEFRDQKSTNLITDVWKNDSYEVRKVIYLFSRHVQNFPNPIARMLMVEVLEVTFDKFKAAIHPVLKEHQLYDHLHYFGKKHEDTEQNHSTGISEDEIVSLIEALPEELKPEMVIVINELFDQMYKMMEVWAEA